MLNAAVESRLGWRVAMALGGGLFMVGGSQHPSGGDENGTRAELATMMDDDAWYLSHALILAGAALLAFGLYVAWRRQAWRDAGVATRLAAGAWTLFAVESVFHLFSAVDADALRAGDAAPIAYIHLGLAAVIYPLTGIALIGLTIRLFGVWPVAAKVFAAGAVVGGVAMALSVPLALATNMNTDIFFMLGGILPALWAITAGIVGERSTTIDVTDPARVAMSA